MRVDQGQLKVVIQVVGINVHLLKALHLKVAVVLQILLVIDVDSVDPHFNVQDEYLTQVNLDIRDRQSLRIQK